MFYCGKKIESFENGSEEDDAWDPINLELQLRDLREAATRSVLKLAEVDRHLKVGRQYVQVVERRQVVVDEMAEELGDDIYSKFELKLWWDLHHYWQSEKTDTDKDALARALIGTPTLLLLFTILGRKLF